MDAVVVLTIGYRGAGFCGFARQPGLGSVQGEIESAVTTLFRRPIEVIGAGRTDAGVHAWGQVVSFPVTRAEADAVNPSKLLRSLNALTGDDLIVRDFRLEPAGFSARYNAISREYRYYLATGPTPPLFVREIAVHQPAVLDLDAMREAASHLTGEHDFRSFCVTSSADLSTTVRTLESIEITDDVLHLEPVIMITVRGKSFLHSMVRTIVGTLIQVGKGKESPEWVLDVLEARNRDAAGPTAPAHGLVFYGVTYPAHTETRDGTSA